MQLDLKALGRRIREQRQKLGLSRSQLAEIIGVSDYYVGQLERGERVMSLAVFMKVVFCLRVSPDYLLTGAQNDDILSVSDPGHTHYFASSKPDPELTELLARCSSQELELIKEIVKLLLAYTSAQSLR
ncbi:MAG: helix-turn-helix transcriptional regulator [Syntrophothermus sp.]|uniref:helix-turn-helix domain-containing protein n=1 Tax=Syntrophothermus sp. TaxID=2736299 RepID=UPI002579DCAC|nr:helix-turn-helix transcriptional regulator [Syntrophothermus sp.]NSW81685.1 helix-turn-helix transcriptional regulator [Syntrophothermus sp.]